MPNIFDSLDQMRSTGALASAPSDAPKSADDDVFSQLDSLRVGQQATSPASKLQLAQGASYGEKPDASARALQLQMRTGLPASLIRDHLDEVDFQSNIKGFDAQAFARSSPMVAAWAAQSPDHAAALKNDLSALGAIEKNLTRPSSSDIAQRYGRSFGAGVLHGASDVLQGASQLSAIPRHLAQSIGNALGVNIPESSIPHPWWLDPQQITGRESGALNDWADGIDVPSDQRTFGNRLASGIGQVVPVIGAALTGNEAGIGAMALQGGGSAAQLASEKGATTGQQDEATAAGALIGAVGGRYGLSLLMHSLPQLAKNRIINAVAGLALRSGGNAADAAAQQVAGNIADRAIYDPSRNPLDGVVDSGAMGGSLGLLASVLGDGIPLARTMIRGSRSSQASIQQVLDAANDSTLKKSAPDVFQDAMKAAKGDASNVYIPASEFRKYFQEEGISPDAAATDYLGSTDAYHEALVTGGDLAIPTEVVAAKIAGTPVEKGLRPHMRLDPEQMTQAELEQYDKQRGDLQRAVISEDKPADRTVFNDVRSQLMDAGSESGSADRQASLYESAFNSLGERAGVDPTDLYRQYGLKIGRNFEAKQGASVLAQALASNPPEGWINPRSAGPNDDALRPLSDYESDARTPSSRKSLTENQGSGDFTRFEQPADGSTLSRGNIQFGRDRKFSISLNENADLSTFLHETGHFYLEVLGDLAEREDAPQQIKDDYQTILNWTGAKTRDGVKTEHHEKFARGFEAYLREGKAPSDALTGAFARFKAWLSHVYRSVKQLRVSLNDDVRQVMDRILATDEEIHEANRQQPNLFSTSEDAGMTPEQFAAYKSAAEQATQEAQDAVTSKVMRELASERTKVWKEARGKIRSDVSEEMDARPVYAALDGLRKNGEDKIRLDRAAVEKIIGPELAASLPKAILVKSGGIDPDLYAEQFGYDSADKMLREIITAPGKKASIEAETDARMRQQHGDALPETLANDAITAVHNDRRALVIRKEIVAVRRLAKDSSDAVKLARNEERAKSVEKVIQEKGKTSAARDALSQERKERSYEHRWRDAERNTEDEKARAVADEIPSTQVFQATARDMLGKKAIGDIKPNDYLLQERRSARAAFRAMGRKDYGTAAIEKRRELLNHYLYREAVKATEEADAIAGHMLKYGKESYRQRLGKAGEAYLEQIDGLLDQYEFARVPNKTLAARQSLAAFIASKAGDGEAFAIDPALLEQANTVNYRNLRLDQLQAIRDAATNLYTLARAKNEITRDGKKVAIEQAADEMVQALDDRYDTDARPPSVSKSSASSIDKLFSLLRSGDASSMPLEHQYRMIDGNKINGPFTRMFRGLSDAMDRRDAMLRDHQRPLVDVYKEYGKEGFDHMNQRFHVATADRSFTQREAIAVALNSGTESNLKKLRDGYQWNQAVVEEILSHLNPLDWKLVQTFWKQFSDMWEPLSDMEKRLSGLAPEAVETRKVKTPFGEIDGGYYPVKYDNRLPGAPLRDQGSKGVFGPGYTMATTPKGWTKARTNFTGPISLDLSDGMQILSEHVHDLAMREAIMDSNKLLSRPEVANAIKRKLGPERHQVMTNWLKQVAHSAESPASTRSLEGFLNHARSASATAAMGFNLFTALGQLGGFGTSVLRMKSKSLLSAMAQFSKSPKETLAFVRGNSLAMANRIDTTEAYLRDKLSELDTGHSKLSSAAKTYRRGAFTLIHAMDSLTSGITWKGAYDEALAGGMSHADAVAKADSEVRVSQGSNREIDNPELLFSGNKLGKLFGQYYGPFSAMYGTYRMLHTDAAVGNVGKMDASIKVLASLMFMGPFIDLITGKGPDEDENPLWWFAKSMGTAPLGMFVLIRDLTGGASSFGSTPLAATARGLAGLESDFNHRHVRRVSQTVLGALEHAAPLVGYPLRPVRAAHYAWDVASGNDEVKSVTDFAKGITGAYRKPD